MIAISLTCETLGVLNCLFYLDNGIASAEAEYIVGLKGLIFNVTLESL